MSHKIDGGNDVPKPKKVTEVIKPPKNEFLEYFKSLHADKDIDAIAETIWNIITMYGLTMADVAALNYYIMERTLKTPVNQKVLLEDAKIDISKPTYHTGGVITSQQKVLDVQRALLSKYVGELKGGNKNDN